MHPANFSILTAWVTFLKRPLGVPPTCWVGEAAVTSFGVLRFQLLQLPGQGVVFEVLQLGGVLIVIKAVILLDNSAQFLNALSGFVPVPQFHSPA